VGAVVHHARTVSQKAALRRMILAAGEIHNLAQSPGDDGIGAVVTQAKALIEEATRRALPLADLVPWAAMLEDPDKASWLVQGILPDAGLVVVAGEGGEGKGWLALSLATAVSEGKPWLGQQRFAVNRAGPCLYVDAERGRRYMGARLKQITKANGKRPAISFLFRPPKFDIPWITSLVERHRPTLLVLDSLRRLLPPGVKDTDNAAMAEVLGALRDIAEKFGCCVLVIHHWRKRSEFGDNRPKARFAGATAIVDVADVAVGVWKEAKATLHCEIVKSYWGDAAGAFLADWQGGENGGTELVYGGEAEPERVTKKELAREVILAAVESEPRTRERLDNLCAKQGIPKRIVTDALKELQQNDQIRRGMQGKQALFGLPA